MLYASGPYYAENYAGIIDIGLGDWLLHCDRYVRQYYCERYNRDVQVHNLEN